MIANMSNASFHWDDPPLLDRQLSKGERMVHDAANAYCQNKLTQRAGGVPP